MTTLWLLATAAASPSPSPSTPAIDPDRVSPGLLGFASVVFLGLAVFVIWKSLNTQIRRVDFDEAATERPRKRRPGVASPPSSPSPSPLDDAAPTDLSPPTAT